MDLEKLERETRQIATDVLDKAGLVKGNIFVLGLSSSEVMGDTLASIPAGKSVRSLSRPC